jgi:hypothetical protein
MTSGLGLTGAGTEGFCLMGAGGALVALRAAAGLAFTSEAAGLGFFAGAGLDLARFAATAERAIGLAGLEAFLDGAAGRLLGRVLPTEPRDAFDDFAIVRRRRAR